MATEEGLQAQRRVLIAVDDSEVSSYAFTWGIRNLIREDDHVIVLTATPFEGLDYAIDDVATGTEYGGKGIRMSDILVAGTEHGIPVMPTPDEAEAANQALSNESKALVSKYLELLLQSRVLSCQGEVVKGDAGSWIADEAQRLAADVIIVGSHAAGILSRTLIGSTSDYVMSNAPCTVAIVRQSPEALTIHDPLASSGGVRKIVIAVDESKEAIHAFTWALKNFCTAQDKVILYHVHQTYVAPITTVGTGEFGMEDIYVLSDVAVQNEIASLKDSQKVVEKFMEYANFKSDVKCEGMIVTGETQAKVIEGLNALKADAVIVGRHDRSVIARTFLGSVSDHLAHNSPCPLIVVKGENHLVSQSTGDSTSSGASPGAAHASSPPHIGKSVNVDGGVSIEGSPQFANPSSPRRPPEGVSPFSHEASPLSNTHEHDS